MKLILPQQYKSMPWKNGQGVTAEIARHPENGDFEWRVSQATIACDSSFSRFENYDRWLAVWRGDGLVMNGKPLMPLQPVELCGEDPVQVKLMGSQVEDLGVIYLRARYQVSMVLVTGDVTLESQNTYLAFDIRSGATRMWERPIPQTVALSESLLIAISKRPR